MNFSFFFGGSFGSCVRGEGGIVRTGVMHDYNIGDAKEGIQCSDIIQGSLWVSGYVAHDKCIC